MKRIVNINKELLLSVEDQIRIGVGMLGEKVDVVNTLREQPSVPVIHTAEFIGELFRNRWLPYAGEEVAILLRTIHRLLANACS